MKKILLALSMIMTVGLTGALAAEETEVDPKVLSSFHKEFSFAENVKWVVESDFIAARFSMNDQGFVAYFNTEGELLGTARNILYMQLPLSVIRQIENRFATADISNLVEFTKDNQSSYFMEVEKRGKKFLVQAFSSGNLYVVKRLKK